MSRRSTIWKVVAGVYAFVNGAGLAYALAQEEGMHAMMHLFLLLLGVAGYVGYLLARRGAPADHLPRAELAESRLEYLQQSVDAMALELERVGEAQRFNDKLRVEKGAPPPSSKDQ
jgi:hypothetical protein